MVGFICWEQFVNPEPMFEFLMKPPAVAVVFPEPPIAVIEVRHESESSDIDHVEFTAAALEVKKREEKLGLFRNNCRGFISPLLFGTYRELGFLGVAFLSAFVFAVGTQLESGPGPTDMSTDGIPYVCWHPILAVKMLHFLWFTDHSIGCDFRWLLLRAHDGTRDPFLPPRPVPDLFRPHTFVYLYHRMSSHTPHGSLLTFQASLLRKRSKPQQNVPNTFAQVSGSLPQLQPF